MDNVSNAVGSLATHRESAVFEVAALAACHFRTFLDFQKL